jgi:hypothetical protein
MQRPKGGILETQTFESIVDEEAVDVSLIKTVKDLALHVKSYG